MTGAVIVWLSLLKGPEGLKWEKFSPKDNDLIEKAKSTGAASVKLGARQIEMTNMQEITGGKKYKLQSFRVLWEWDDGEGGKAAPEWRPYPQQVQWQLEAAMCDSDMTCEVSVAKDKKYLVDLVGLRQHSSKDVFRTRRVRRRGVPLREPFPPRVRDVASGAWLDLTAKPSYWKSHGSSSSSATVVKQRQDLPKDSPVFQEIEEWINSTIRTGHAAAYGQVPGKGGATRGMEVTRIEVVQQPALWRRYCCYKEKMRLQSKLIKSHEGTKYLDKHPMAMPTCDWLDKDVNEAYFWHGSGKSADGKIDLVDAIVSVGHEPSDENSEVMEVSDGASSRFAKTSSMFGSGVYLADISSKANLYVPCSVCYGGAYFRHSCSCTKAAVEKALPYRMLLCRAVLGRVYVERKYKDSRYKGDFNPAKKLGVESVMGEAVPGQLAFREYVVYSDQASYPEFIVYYRRRSEPIKSGPPKKKAKKS